MKDKERYSDAYATVRRDRERLIQQNKRYRETLEFYANKNNMIGLEMGEKARKTLEETKK